MNPRAILLVIMLPAVAAMGAEKDRVLVVYNPRLEGSEEIAEFYAKKRGLSKDQLFGLECPPNESVSREEFRDTIQRPLIDHLVEEGWWKIARKNIFMASGLIRALGKGLPLTWRRPS